MLSSLFGIDTAVHCNPLDVSIVVLWKICKETTQPKNLPPAATVSRFSFSSKQKRQLVWRRMGQGIILSCCRRLCVVPMTGSGLADAVVANHSGLQQPPTSMNATAAAAAAAVQLQAVSNNVASRNNSAALLWFCAALIERPFWIKHTHYLCFFFSSSVTIVNCYSPNSHSQTVIAS